MDSSRREYRLAVSDNDEELARRLHSREQHQNPDCATQLQRNGWSHERHDHELARRMAGIDIHVQGRSHQGVAMTCPTGSNQSINGMLTHTNDAERRLSSIQESLAYARRLQEEAFSNLQHNSPTKGRQNDVVLQSDLELARRMQELENKGLGRLNSEREVEVLPDDEHSLEGSLSPPSFVRSTSATLSSQEHEDERLARFMEESGTSIRDMSEVELNQLLGFRAANNSNSALSSANTEGNVATSSPSRPPATGASAAAVRNAYNNASFSIPSSPDPWSRPIASKNAAQSVPTRMRSGVGKSGAPFVTIPLLDPLDNDAWLDIPIRLKDKKKKRSWFGNRSTSKKPPASPRSGISNGSTSPGRPSGIPSTIPPPPGGSISMSFPPPASPSQNHNLAARPPVSPLLLESPVASSSKAEKPTKKWLPPSPLIPATKRNNESDIIPPTVRPGPLPHSLSIRSNISEHMSQVRSNNMPPVQRDTQVCVCCRQPGGSLIAALEKTYHTECFRCSSCNERIDHLQPFAFTTDKKNEKHPLHRRCFAEMFGIKCAVCRQAIPANDDGTVCFVKHPFFETEQMCLRHAQDPGRRCTGCHRFEPENEPFADLCDNDRCVCYSCSRTVIVDNADVQPLWNKVLSFFENNLDLPVWKEMKEIPILVVQSDALNDSLSITDNPHWGASQIMARGLCLTDHHHERTMLKLPSMRFERSTNNFEALDSTARGFTYYQVPRPGSGNPNSNVFAILCLSGLPRDLTASILAHEATHAWIKLHPNYDCRRPIPAQVEEGCAQLLAMLLLCDGLDPPDSTVNDDDGPSDEKLRQYFKFSIERDDNEIYGMGYRRAAMAYRDVGIEALLSHVVMYRDFPST